MSIASDGNDDRLSPDSLPAQLPVNPESTLPAQENLMPEPAITVNDVKPLTSHVPTHTRASPEPEQHLHAPLPIKNSRQRAASGSTRGRPRGGRHQPQTFLQKENQYAKHEEAWDWLLRLPPANTENLYIKNIESFWKAEFVVQDGRFQKTAAKPKAIRGVNKPRSPKTGSPPAPAADVSGTKTSTRQSPRTR